MGDQLSTTRAKNLQYVARVGVQFVTHDPDCLEGQAIALFFNL